MSTPDDSTPERAESDSTDGTVATPITEFPGFFRLMARGLTRRCPWCGDRRAYFTGWFTRTDRCRRCRHPYRRGDEAFELGATTANIILTFLSILIATVIHQTIPKLDPASLVRVNHTNTRLARDVVG